jgi:hypothetical protein
VPLLDEAVENMGNEEIVGFTVYRRHGNGLLPVPEIHTNRWEWIDVLVWSYGGRSVQRLLVYCSFVIFL